MLRKGLVYLTMLFSLLPLAPMLHAQDRMNDRDVQRLLENLKDDAKPFRETFASALKKSSIRKTSRERDARSLGDRFFKESEQALDIFKHKHQFQDQLTALVQTAGQIDPLVYNLNLNSQTKSQWEKIRAELHEAAQAFHVREPYLDSSAGANGLAQVGSQSSGSCSTAVGVERSRRLVSECTQVSPSTHSPCNAENSCVMIIDEIKRGCSASGQGSPLFCREYQ